MNTNGEHLPGYILLSNIRPHFKVILVVHYSVNNLSCISWLSRNMVLISQVCVASCLLLINYNTDHI